MESPARTPADITCPLCQSSDTHFWYQDKKRSYQHCPQCDLVFVDRSQHLSHDDEKSVYDLHENNDQDMGYREFLSRMADPVRQRVPAGSHGLDFGCGPGPVLAQMFRETGYKMNTFDVYYANQPDVMTQQYDFITSTEVFEHLSAPATVLEQLSAILKSGGYLGIMTKRVTSQEAFASWHYKNDPTHITFFSENSFHWIARHYRMTLEIISQDVVILQKKTDDQQ